MGKLVYGVLKQNTNKQKQQQNKNSWEQHIKIINKQLTKMV